MSDKDGKTEKPTAKRLREGRKDGQFARTPDAPTWLGIAAGAAMLPRTVTGLAETFRDLIAMIPDVAADPTPARALKVVSELPMSVIMAVGPLAIAAALGATIGAAAQGVYPSAKALKPKFSRLDPRQGLKRMFGPKALWEATKSVVKVTVIAVVVLILGRTLVPELVGAGPMPLVVTLDHTRSGMQRLLWATAITGLLLALADYAYQRRTVMKELKMSPHDIKQEMRQSDGDPLMKGAIRSRQMTMSRNRMLSAVIDADVVLVNPTHFAVALKYDPAKGAPRVIAKGAGALALKIRERARDARVPVVEDKPLTRLLYRVCDLDDEIPQELYIAVARILAFVMSAGKPSRTATPRRPAPGDQLPDLPARSAMRARRVRENRAARQAAQTSQTAGTP